MVVILVDWKIKEDRAEEFENFWKTLGNVEGKNGFYCEILTKPEPQPDSKFNTLGLTDRNYLTYVNIAFWSSVEDFETAVRESMPKTSQITDPASGRTKQSIELERFEYKIRERIVLIPIAERGGALPNFTELKQAGRVLLVRKMAG
jgi:heme-degrading monooxygenase HmoA